MLSTIRTLAAARRLPSALSTRLLTTGGGAPRDLDTSSSHTVSLAELQKFTSVSNEWWDTQGAFKYLHTMNRTRTQYIQSRLRDLHPELTRLAGRTIIDVGCGGGLASEALARLGAHVTGVDAAQENIAVARIHAQQDPGLAGNLVYRQCTAEQVVAEKQQFDAVVSLEVIEHVRDPVHFVHSLVELAKPGAPIFISTMNRTALSLLVDIVVPEYILNIVPRGTHQHSKFIAPEELTEILHALGTRVLDTQGLVMDPIMNKCHLVDRDMGLVRNAGVQANYIMMARKN
ncbi:Hexaprenyldihydroxybenzoate methyltransferase, mitochondrial [Linderina pennispora]|nr:Hexaprenyldihydroxybenzoate methyltransferase, mitochondrial [Linderina pennispora]